MNASPVYRVAVVIRGAIVWAGWSSHRIQEFATLRAAQSWADDFKLHGMYAVVVDYTKQAHLERIALANIDYMVDQAKKRIDNVCHEVWARWQWQAEEWTAHEEDAKQDVPSMMEPEVDTVMAQPSIRPRLDVVAAIAAFIFGVP